MMIKQATPEQIVAFLLGMERAMAVHHFTAPDLVIDTAGWQPMDTFPQDGTIVEITDDKGLMCRAQWHSGRILTATLSAGAPQKWRTLE